jgi:hypothetical protein
MDGQSEIPREPRSGPVVAGLAPLDEAETSEVPDSLVADFSSLTTPYCWVITEDAVAGYDGARPSAVGQSGPGHAVAGDVTEALTAGRFFRLVYGAVSRDRGSPARACPVTSARGRPGNATTTSTKPATATPPATMQA